MTCFNSLCADMHAHNEGCVDELESYRESMLNNKADEMIKYSHSSEQYQNIIERVNSEKEFYLKFDAIIHKIINTSDKSKIIDLCDDLRAVIKSAAMKIIEENELFTA